MANLRHTFKGYLYQDLVSALKIAETLLGRADRVVLDTKLHQFDVFDDVSVWTGNRRVRRQVKHASDAARMFEAADLRTHQSNTRVDVLCRSVLAAGSACADEHRVCACWSEPSDADLKLLLVPTEAFGTFPGCRTSLYKLNLSFLWPAGGNPAWPFMNSDGLSRDQYAALCNRLVLEIACPRMSADLRTPGPAESVLLQLLADEIGVGRFPNQHISAEDAAARLVYEAMAARASGRQIVESDVQSMLRLRTDYGRVAQRFPIRAAEAVDFSNSRKAIRDCALQSQRVLVVGPPGSGKSWLLTQLAHDLQSDGGAVGRHYCYISVNDLDASKRVLTETLYGNLTA